MKKNIKVRHSIKTQDEKAPDGSSWIDFWRTQTKRGIPTICPCCGKSVKGENYMVGAHVELFIELASIKHKQFITPTCNICNSTYKESKYFHSFNVDVADLLEIEE